MTLVFTIIRYQWLAYWRNLRAKSLMAGANMAVTIIFGIWLLPGHIMACVLAARRMQTNPEGAGAILTEVSALAVFAAWLVLPLLASSVQARGEGITPMGLRQFPLSMRQLFFIGVGGSLIHPLYWLLILGSLALLAPLLAGPNPVGGLVGGMLFIVASACLSWAISLIGAAVFASRRAREIALMFVLFGGLAFLGLAQLDIEREDGAIYVEGWGEGRHLVMNTEGTEGFLVRARSVTPGALVTDIALGHRVVLNLAILATLAGAGFAASVWGLRRAVMRPAVGVSGPGRRRRSIGVFRGLPPRIGAPAIKEVRYLVRTLDNLLGVVIGLGVAIFLIWNPDITPFLPPGAIVFMVLSTGAMPNNVFGLDRLGVDRYRVLPLSGREILIGKNAAYLAVISMQIVPVLLGSLVRFGPAFTLTILFGAWAFVFLAMALGNYVSVRSPAPRDFFNFDSKEQTGGILPQLYLMAVWIVPALLGLGAAQISLWLAAVVELIVLGVCVFVYRVTLGPSATQFEGSAEMMRDRLAG